MVVGIQWNPATDNYALYFVESVDGQRVIYRAGSDGRLISEPVEHGASVAAPTIVLPPFVMRALGEALSDRGFMPKKIDETPAIQAHLADAVIVRDRLLAIVERK